MDGGPRRRRNVSAPGVVLLVFAGLLLAVLTFVPAVSCCPTSTNVSRKSCQACRVNYSWPVVLFLAGALTYAGALLVVLRWVKERRRRSLGGGEGGGEDE